MSDMTLSGFMPKSELVVESHQVLIPKYPVVDFHTHFGIGGFPSGFFSYASIADSQQVYDIEKEMEDLAGFGIAAIVNLDGFWGEKLDEVLEHTGSCQEKIATFGSVDVTRLDDPGFPKYAAAIVRECHGKGASGLKFLKDVSLKLRDINGKYIRIDDKRLKPVWEAAAELNMPVLIHIGDPRAFFRPVDKYNERFTELSRNPEWSFAGSEFFTYEELMEMQERLLADNPRTVFVIAHCGSAPENLDYVAGLLDRYPNMNIDIAARIAELGRQPYTSRKFLIRYQDRVVFGTDSFPGRRIYPYYYRFLETWDEYFDYSPKRNQGEWKIYGICLPDDVLKKIYHGNAVRLVPELCKAVDGFSV